MATPDDNYMATLLAECQKRDDERIEAAKATLRKEVIPKLKKQGVTTVHAHYSGYGDSGCIETVDYLDAGKKPIAILKGQTKIDAVIQDALYGFLPSGFEIDDGGQGDITIDIQAGTVTLEHQENYVRHNDTTLEYML